jgi:dTMP kinase
MKKAHLICFIGLDGSGKSTLANKFVEKLTIDNIKSKHIWGGYELYLMKPIVLLSQRFFSKNVDMYEDYNAYHKSITSSAKNPLVSFFYEKLTLIEYFIQMFIKINIPLMLGKTIVSDRYIYDIIVNLSVNMGYDEKKFKALLNTYQKYLPDPDIVFYIHVPEEVSLSRKDDIPSIEYLTLRKKLYDSIENAIYIDGNRRKYDVEVEVFSYYKSIFQDQSEV